MTDQESNKSFFFAGAPTSSATVAMAAVADAILSRNGSFASRHPGFAEGEQDAPVSAYLPLPAHRSASECKRDRAAATDDEHVFSPRDCQAGVGGVASQAAEDEGGIRLAPTGDAAETPTVQALTGDDATFAPAEAQGDEDENSENRTSKDDGKPKATPLPIWQVLIIGSVLLTESLSGMMLMPFVGLFVAHLMNWTVERAGYLSGVLVGMFMLGQVLSGKLWGHISDRHGRKTPLVVGLGVGATMMFVFGISPNIYVACVARFIHGFFNGTVLIAKTVVSDITDNSNRAKGFAWVSLAWAIGSLVGPTIGGFLYDPATNSKFAAYHISKDSFLGHHPAFLPATILAGYIAFSFTICILFLKESNPSDRSALELIPGALRRWCVRRGCTCLALPRDRHRDKDENPYSGALDSENEQAHSEVHTTAMDTEMAQQDPHAHSVSSASMMTATKQDPNRTSDTKRAETAVKGTAEMRLSSSEDLRGVPGDCARRSTESRDNSADARGDTSPQPTTVSTVAVADSAENEVDGKFTYMDAIRYPPSRYLLLMFMLYCALEIIYSEVMPLWAVAGRDVGGLGLFSDDVAILLLVCGAPALVANLVFPLLCDRVFARNKMRFWQISIVINAVCTAIVPVAAYVHGKRGGFWFTLGIGLVRQFGLSWCFGLAQYLVPYVAKKGHVGTMFGINQAAGSATRCVIPFGAAPLFAWSISGRGRPFPINHFLLFMICVLCASATFVISFVLKIPVEIAYHETKRAREEQRQQEEEADAAMDEPVVLDGQELVAKKETQ